MKCLLTVLAHYPEAEHHYWNPCRLFQGLGAIFRPNLVCSFCCCYRSRQPQSSSVDTTIPRSDHDATRSAFTLMNPRQTNSDMSVSPSISSLTLTSVSDPSSQATIIPVENLKKRTLDEKTEEDPSKKRKTLELSAEPLPFYKEARPDLSRMVKTRELVSFLRKNTSKELSHAGLTVHYVVYADDIAEYAYNGR